MRRIVVCLLALAIWCPRSIAQPSITEPSAPTIAAPVVDLEAEQARLRDATKGWSDSLKGEDGSLDTDNAVVQAYQSIESLLKAIDEHRARAAEFDQSRLEAPTRLQSIQNELAQPPAEPTLELPPDATLTQLEQRLAEARAQLDTARQQVADLAAEKASRETAIADTIPKELPTARQQLSDVQADIDAGGGESPLTEEEPVRSQRLLKLAQRLELQARVARLEKQRDSIEARRALLPKRQELAARRVSEAERLVSAWDQTVSARRQKEAEDARRQAEELRRKAARQHPVLNEYAETNAELAKELGSLQEPTGNGSLAQQTAIIVQRREALAASISKLRVRVKLSGLDDATGLALRRSFALLGDLDKTVRDAEEAADRARDIEYRLQEVLAEIDDVNRNSGSLDALIRRLDDSDDPIENRDELVNFAGELVGARRDLLDKLANQLETKSTELTALVNAYTNKDTGLIPEMKSSIAFIEERILWVRSVAGPAIPGASGTAEALRWLTNPRSWSSSIESSWRAIRYERLRFVSIACALILLVIIRLRAPARLNRLNGFVRSFRTDRLIYTIRALIVTTVMSLPVPMALRAMAWFLDRPVNASELALSVAGGLRASAALLFVLVLTRNILRSNGVGERHFTWQTAGVRTIRNNLRWFIPLITLLWGATITLDIQSANEIYNDTLGRLSFVGTMIVLSLFLALILKPTGAVLAPIVKAHEDRWLDRLSPIWYTAAIALPLALAGLSLAKYYYTALRLQHLMFSTLWLIGALVLLTAITGRWHYIARRRIAIENAKRKREQVRAAMLADAERYQGETSPPPPPAVDPDEVDIPALDSKMRQAMRTGIGLAFLIGIMMIWTEVLPAFKMLDRVQVWPIQIGETETQVQQRTTTTDQQSDLTTPTSPAPYPGIAKTDPQSAGAGDAPFRLSLLHLAMAIFFGVITVLAVRNLPAVVELILLQHLPLDAASRYALVSVLRYFLAIVGVTLAMNAMGISWSTVQWLAAALTFGLAFGLQEIFANFVSGLIILAERPIRVGDTVTVGDTDGTVARIRMRATTIVGWDRRELIIPNKSFITDRVINWTLSDSVQRIVVPVGVAYGSDLDKVERTLMEACKSVPESLEDPAPTVLYRGFGDSTLNWEARIFIGSLDVLVPARTKLYKAIDMAFRREGIEIAFPQVDLHVRSSEELSEILRCGALARRDAGATQDADSADPAER